MTPSRFIDLYLQLRAGLTGRSATGYQLERLRLNLPGGGNPNAQEEARAFYSHLAYAVECLTDEERTVIFALRTPRSHDPLCGYPTNPVSTCQCGAIVTVEREIRSGDLHVVERENPDGSRDRIQETHAGERYLRPGHAPGFAVVLGVRAVYPTREQVAASLGLEFLRVKRLVRTAYEKLEAVTNADASAGDSPD